MKIFLFSYLRVVLNGPGVLGEHCVLENLAGTVTLIPQEGALCSVNGSVLKGPCQLTQGKNFKADVLAQSEAPVKMQILTHDCKLEAVAPLCVGIRPLHIFMGSELLG